ncbi:hypothetical protein [Maridesulfovibrio bastinii]|uniref:hypothetical protein n=1 Tax=Maridesulfovibrio bastinii TaxID=47157 RepID=UPI000423F818|nr:hypothetical protein [Maridesulfovibrio bastinii]
MPNSSTTPESVVQTSYQQALDIQELTRLLLHHTFLETIQGEGQILPGQLTMLEVLSERIDGLVDSLDVPEVRHV